MWAPSIKVIIPAFFALLQISSTGNRIAVGEVKWLMKIILVLGFTLFQISSHISSWEGAGMGIKASFQTAPLFMQYSVHDLLQAPYSWSVPSISSPSLMIPCLHSAYATMLTADVEFVTYVIFYGFVPTNSARACLLYFIRPAISLKKRTGCSSIKSIHRLCSSSITFGQAPYEPWFRK